MLMKKITEPLSMACGPGSKVVVVLETRVCVCVCMCAHACVCACLLKSEEENEVTYLPFIHLFMSMKTLNA